MVAVASGSPEPRAQLIQKALARAWTSSRSEGHARGAPSRGRPARGGEGRDKQGAAVAR